MTAGGLVGRAVNGAWKALYVIHYGWLYGRRYPGSERVTGWIRGWERRTGRGDVPVSREEWERQYGGGRWEFLRGADEVARYGVIAGYLRHLCRGGAVLDVGCGEGLLREEMGVAGYSRYVGLDLAEKAIARAAAAAAGEGVAFVAGDAETFVPEGRFDAVVFNECLYYFEDPVGAVRRYQGYLAPGGTVVVSMFRSRRAEAIQRGLEAALPLVEKVTIAGRKGVWTVSLFQGGLAPLEPPASG